ncbi:hypothetical protein CPY51_23270 [Rhizobium tubonense]|uniref:Pirin C-terminal domain-containing protein n=1 Tax=Rhizobium tubonense TaxID=484088 RepID=A0A2W4E4E6_9HYPH|nr:hypothetical protein CPY51_23270 [Rhizobium tubonense]
MTLASSRRFKFSSSASRRELRSRRCWRLKRSCAPQRDGTWLTRSDESGPSELVLRADAAPVRLLVFSGRPLKEPVAFGGPFVMNTQDEVQQAFADFRAGRF